MSELIIANKDDLTDIADAVRSQTGEANPLSLNDIASEIRTLSAGGGSGAQADEGKVLKIINGTPTWSL